MTPLVMLALGFVAGLASSTRAIAHARAEIDRLHDKVDGFHDAFARYDNEVDKKRRWQRLALRRVT
jgi:hypothetical protein